MMPSSRRIRIVIIALVVAMCTIFYLSNDSSSQEFYTRTVAALDKNEASDVEVARKLHEVKDAAKAQEPMRAGAGQKLLSDDKDAKKAHAEIEVPQKLPSNTPISGKAPSDNRPDLDDKKDGEKSVAGRKTMKETKKLQSEKETPSGPSKDKATEKDSEKKEAKEETPESKEAHELETEINSILKKGPIIIFSKSYCQFSKKAKRILLDKYTIVPAPYVVELDQHPLGSKMQDTLQKMTGRRTVPNILINGKSIGGGDDIEALDNGTNLIDKIKDMGGKRIMEAKLKDEK